jgi:hypothetical protein
MKGPSFDSARAGYVLEEVIEGKRVRFVVPDELVSDELGSDADEIRRRRWIEDNLAAILGAGTARLQGGLVTAPWGRVLIEEVE